MDWTFDRLVGLAGLALGAVGIIIGLGVAIAMDPKSRHEMQFSIACFVISGICLCVAVGMWAFVTSDSLLGRFILSGFFFACIGISTVEASRWVSSRYKRTTDEAAIVANKLLKDRPTITENPAHHEASATISWKEVGMKTPTSAYMIVKVDPPFPDNAPFRMFLTARVVDNTIDEMYDARVLRSSLRSVTSQTIEIPLTQEFMKRAFDSHSSINLRLIVMPDDVDINQIKSLADVSKFGGKFAVDAGFFPNIQKHVNPEPDKTSPI